MSSSDDATGTVGHGLGAPRKTSYAGLQKCWLWCVQQDQSFFFVVCCYSYDPLIMLGQSLWGTSMNRKQVNLPFQVLCFPKGYDHQKMKVTNISLKRKHSSEIMEMIFSCSNFQRCCNSFSIWATYYQWWLLWFRKKGLATDVTVATSISLNTFM